MTSHSHTVAQTHVVDKSQMVSGPTFADCRLVVSAGTD